MSVKQAKAPKSSGTAAVAAIPAAVVHPVTEASRHLSNQVTGGLQWYLEKWEDLVVEARAERAAPGSGLAGVQASLPQARVVSEIPGRVRLRLTQLKGQDRLALQAVEALAKLPGVRRVEVSPLTGSILLFYDTATYPSLDSLLQAAAKS